MKSIKFKALHYQLLCDLSPVRSVLTTGKTFVAKPQLYIFQIINIIAKERNKTGSSKMGGGGGDNIFSSQVTRIKQM